MQRMSGNRPRQTSGESPSPSPRSGIPRSPEAITLRSFLNPVTNLDDASRETLRKLLKITVNLRQRTHHSQTRRIQRGSPGAHELGASLAQFRSQVDEIAGDLDEILQHHDGLPGIYLIRSQFALFHETMNQSFNDGGNEGGYFDRVQLLEKLMYLAGTLRGHLEVILEQHSYWKAKLAGQAPPRVVRRLDFNQAVDPAERNQANQQAVPFDFSRNLGQPAQLLDVLGSQGRKHKQFTININLSQHMQSGVIDLWESRRHTDVTFIIGSNQVPAHRVILASQSEYFDRLLFGEMREAHAGAEIRLEDTPLDTFLLLLQYAYSGCLEVKSADMQDVLEIVRLADRFSFTLLKDAMGDQLVGRVNHHNVLQILIYADLYHLPRLQSHCLGFIDKSAAKVLESEALLSLPRDSLKCVLSRDTFYVPEVSIFQALVRWRESNGTSSEQMTEVLSCVRLSEIPPEQLFAVVEPSGLFDGNAILAAIRVQMKPELEQIQPRGKKEEGRNLLKSPTVTVDPPLHTMTSALGLGNSFGPPKAIVADTILNLASPPDLANAPVQGTVGSGAPNAPVHGGLRLGTRSAGMSNPSSISTVTITLDSLYLVNSLILSVTGGQQKAFSYVIRISRDGQHWVELFNYRNYSCVATQDLRFPTQAVRSFKFELTGGSSDANQQSQVKLASCAFTADQKPFMFRDHGIIAPLSPLTPRASQSMIKTNGGHPTCMMTFNQPYSISMLRFKVSGPRYSMHKGDITVSVGTERKEKEFKTIGDLENIAFGTQLTVDFPEQVVSYVMVAIKKTHATPTNTAPSSTKPLPLMMGSALMSPLAIPPPQPKAGTASTSSPPAIAQLQPSQPKAGTASTSSPPAIAQLQPSQPKAGTASTSNPPAIAIGQLPFQPKAGTASTSRPPAITIVQLPFQPKAGTAIAKFPPLAGPIDTTTPLFKVQPSQPKAGAAAIAKSPPSQPKAGPVVTTTPLFQLPKAGPVVTTTPLFQLQPAMSISTTQTVTTWTTRTTPSPFGGMPVFGVTTSTTRTTPAPSPFGGMPVFGRGSAFDLNTTTAVSAASQLGLAPTSTSQPQPHGGLQIQLGALSPGLPRASPAAATSAAFTIVELTCQAGFQGSQE